MKFFFTKKETTPFSTQYEVLNKYNQAINDNGDTVGMCRAMSNLYLSLLLQKKKPEEYLKDDKEFLKEAILEENKELEAEQNGQKDIEHFGFKQHNIPHEDRKFSKHELTQNTFNTLLTQSNHLLITYPIRQGLLHEVYLGKEGSQCRFFDANIHGGERKGPCHQIVPHFVKITQDNYTKEEDDFIVGRNLS